MIGNSCTSDKDEIKKSEEKKNSTIDNLNGNEIPKNKKDSISKETIKTKKAEQEVIQLYCYDGAVEEPIEIAIEDIDIKQIKTKPIKIEADSIESIKHCYTIIQPMCYMVIDPLPEFCAGDPLFKEYLDSNIVRPIGTEHISGTMYLEFVITKSGNIEEIKIQKSLHPDLDKEVIRVLNKLPNRFWPHKASHFETTKYSLPIKFTAK